MKRYPLILFCLWSICLLQGCGGTVAAPMEENGLPILTFDRKAFLEIIG